MEILAIVIAGISLVVAVGSFRLQKKKTQYSEKKAIRDRVLQHLEGIGSGTDASPGTTMNLRQDTKDAELYFGDDVLRFIDEVCYVTDRLSQAAHAYHAYEEKRGHGVPDAETDRLAKEWEDVGIEAADLLDQAKKVFKPYLRLKLW